MTQRKSSPKGSSIICSNIGQLVRNKQERNKALFSILPDGNTIYTYKGKEYSPYDLENNVLPVIALPIMSKGKNKDKTKSFIHNEKSY